MKIKFSILAAMLSIVLAIGIMLALFVTAFLGLQSLLLQETFDQFRGWLFWGTATTSAVVAFVTASVFGNWLQQSQTNRGTRAAESKSQLSAEVLVSFQSSNKPS